MDVKVIFRKVFSSYLVLHLAAMAAVVVLLCVAVKFGLDLYTHHGEGIVVPQLKGMSYDKAYLLLEEAGLRIEVSDSGYNKRQPANSILAQMPNSGQKVKQGHVVYVTVNSPSSPTFAIPDIVDNSSVREAEAKLTAMGFRLLPAQQVEGEKDWVYGIICRGRRVSNGDQVSIEYPLTLLVGKGAYDDTEDVEYADPTYDATQESEVDEFVEVEER
ncbi:MAG: PASTA domain-containing protein [Prevotella sp.]|nr:PASTA domain-containing protein [Prevotella sp.]MBQ9187155.1 PASTA domain-containing protein [Prevotella sp.]